MIEWLEGVKSRRKCSSKAKFQTNGMSPSVQKGCSKQGPLRALTLSSQNQSLEIVRTSRKEARKSRTKHAEKPESHGQDSDRQVAMRSTRVLSHARFAPQTSVRPSEANEHHRPTAGRPRRPMPSDLITGEELDEGGVTGGNNTSHARSETRHGENGLKDHLVPHAATRSHEFQRVHLPTFNPTEVSCSMMEKPNMSHSVGGVSGSVNPESMSHRSCSCGSDHQSNLPWSPTLIFHHRLVVNCPRKD